MRRLLLVLPLLAAMPATLPATLSAQVPEKFENLKFFPKDVARDSLLATMRSFSFGLGVRCVYCHVGEDSPTLAGVDFKSDERLTKRTAREMLRMVADVNTHIAGMPGRENPLTVRCVTCHRGIPRPILLEDTLHRVAAGGANGAAVVAAYDSLRARFYGGASFDFGPMPLVRLSERLFVEQRYEDAVAVLNRNVEANPRFWNTYWQLGRCYEALGRKAEAIAAYRTVLERLPGHEGATARLKALEG